MGKSKLVWKQSPRLVKKHQHKKHNKLAIRIMEVANKQKQMFRQLNPYKRMRKLR